MSDFTGLRFKSAITYTIREQLGRGGMGIVLLADRESEGFRDRVVLKTVTNVSPEMEDGLKREAQLASGVRRHHNIVKTWGLESIPIEQLPEELQAKVLGDAGVDPLRRTSIKRGTGLRQRRGGLFDEIDSQAPGIMTGGEDEGPRLFFIVMEYIDGLDVLNLHTEHLRRGCLVPTMLGAYIVSRVARALEVAHNDLIHRDVSPENVLIDSFGVPMLSDFGIAVAAGSKDAQGAGKLRYVAPELLRGDPVDERIDIYSLGILAYTLATGISLQLPPDKGTVLVKGSAILDAAEAGWPRLDEVMPDIPEAYADIVAGMIHPDPEQRTPRASTVANELEQLVLYVSGLGPSHQALASYIEIFENGFTRYDDEQLAQLAFLRDGEGRLQLKRALEVGAYSDLGRELIDARAGSLVAICLSTGAEPAAAVAAEAPARKRKAAGPPRAVLKIRFSDNCLESVPFDDALDIGRSAGVSQVVLLDRLASRKHARIKLLPSGSAQLRDWGSNNGTYVGSERIEMSVLEEGNAFRIGKTTLYFLREPTWLPPSEPHADPEAAGPDLLAGRPVFGVGFVTSQRGRWMPFWQSLGTSIALSDKASFVFATALTEACGLTAEPTERLAIRVVRERSRLRLFLHGVKGTEALTRSVIICKKLAAGQEVDLLTRGIAVQLIRHVFDRVDFYETDGLLLLSKTF